MSNQRYELVIAGTGPAGFTAAIYAARTRLSTPLLKKAPLPRGLPAITHYVENYPGYEKGVSGQELTERMADQAKKSGLTISNETNVSVNFKNNRKVVNAAERNSHLKTQGVFIYAGLDPSTRRIGQNLEMDDGGYVVTDQKLPASVEGVLASGDVRSTRCRQVATVAGDGALAAFMVAQCLSTH